MNTTEHKKLRNVLFNRFMGMAKVNSAYHIVVKAFLFAEQLHQGVRKDGVTPEFYHQLSILGRSLCFHDLLTNPVDVYVAILLHDSPEDYPHVIGRIKTEFPNHAAFSLSLSKYDFIHKEHQPPEVIKKSMSDYMQELSESPVLSVAKLLDRLHNLSTMLGVFSPEKIMQYIQEVEEYFLPMLKQAKARFPEQEAVYEIIKSDLNMFLRTVKFFVQPTA